MHSPEQILAWEKAIYDGDYDKATKIKNNPTVIKSSKGKHGTNYTPPKKKRK